MSERIKYVVGEEQHTDEFGIWDPGSVIHTDRPMDELFPGKFERLSDTPTVAPAAPMLVTNPTDPEATNDGQEPPAATEEDDEAHLIDS